MDLFTSLNELPYLPSSASDVNFNPCLFYAFITSSMVFLVQSLTCRIATLSDKLLSFLLLFFTMFVSELIKTSETEVFTFLNN